MKTGEDFKQAVQAKGLGRWVMRHCSMCGTELFYLFQDGEVFFSSACNCVTYTSPPEPRTWDSLADLYNMQTNEAFIEHMNEVFGFTEG